MRDTSPVRDVCVIGIGLIGGSLLRAAAKSGRRCWGATDHVDEAALARAEGYDIAPSTASALTRAAERDAIVVLAVPLTAADSVLADIAAIAPTCLLTDVISVKQPVLDSVKCRLPRARYVGSHPMAGTTRSGWQAGDASLFSGAAWVSCLDEDTDIGDWADVARLALDIGATVVPTTAAAHDSAVARISHLPHLLAAVLAGVGAEGGPLALTLAAGSFTDGTRVAATRPELTTAMTEGNRSALLPVFDEALGMLGAARGALASTGSLGATVRNGHAGAQAFAAIKNASRVGVRIALAAPDACAALLALGDQGGRIVEVSDTLALGEVPA